MSGVSSEQQLCTDSLIEKMHLVKWREKPAAAARGDGDGDGEVDGHSQTNDHHY